MQQKKISKPLQKQQQKNLIKNVSASENEIQDERFKVVQFDPRFKQKQKQKLKTKLDSRFSSILNDKKYQITSKFDKYGRKIKAKDKNKEFEKHYYVNDEEQQNQNSSIESEEEEILQKSNKNKYLNENINEQQQGGGFQWNEVSSSEEEDQSDVEEDEDIQNLVEEEEIQEMWDSDDEKQKIQEFEGSTNILALQNFDWTQLKSQDLMLLFNSFKPSDGVITKVSIYPSEFGLQEMKKEQQFGPQNIWKTNNKKSQKENKEAQELNENDNSDEDDNEISKKKKKKFKSEKEINEWIAKEGQTENDLDINKLRKYEKNRLKYYYAIIECDTTKTAEHIYQVMDGLEFELTQMKVDLRFVPKQQNFPQDPIDICTQIPTNYASNTFLNRALNHTNVKLTWEEPNANRFDHLLKKKKLTPEDLQLSYLANYIGSDDEDDNDVEGNKNKLDDDEDFDGVQDSDFEDEIIVEDKDHDNDEDNQDWRQDFNKKRKNKNNMDMEITFSTGFNDLGNKILEKQKEQEESSWQKYLRKKKEKRQERKQLYKSGKNKYKTDDDYFVEPPQPEDNQDEDQEKEKSQKQKQKQREKDELDLLLFDVNKPKNNDKNFKVNVNDERFAAIYQDKQYAIDPTYKNFQNNSTVSTIFNEQVQRRKKLNQQKN